MGKGMGLTCDVEVDQLVGEPHGTWIRVQGTLREGKWGIRAVFPLRSRSRGEGRGKEERSGLHSFPASTALTACRCKAQASSPRP